MKSATALVTSSPTIFNKCWKNKARKPSGPGALSPSMALRIQPRLALAKESWYEKDFVVNIRYQARDDFCMNMGSGLRLAN